MKAVTEIVVFTGHMVDLPGRKVQRFPPMLENAARAGIAKRLAKFDAARTFGIASGARGGDILFHEESRRIGIATVIVLPFSAMKFEETSVAGVDSGNWVARFRQLWSETPDNLRVILNLPAGDNAYVACNTEVLRLAAQHGRMHLIALWDGVDNGKRGGTADMVRSARQHGASVDIINMGDLKP